MAFTVHNVDWEKDKNRLKALREHVFVLEWRVPESSEFDEHDSSACHVLIVDDKNIPIATGRLTKKGELGRIAVKRSHRTLVVYRLLFEALLNVAKRNNCPIIKVVCTLESVSYHRSLGFIPDGQVFMDAGVPRQRLKCPAERFPLPDFTQLH
ncbi:GNAT family N-acetyltransferase [Alteromonas sp. IB21]|uniref:GNAT family N-acetyltransferase n=1 Tax=Alteromonas sp. IB21 TaxID=2779369 RepID=UPI0018E7DEBD|nr:GNAT family N-acetyltransferase [Alteromonas sp. IB21]MBJ2130372.1 GNAT family N-acetyltransferase [Alteromonas sp. IB21]